jgi:riboflavin synthase
LTISGSPEALEIGESIAVNGACLTVAAALPSGFEADLSAETLAATTLGRLPLGARVNLERALALGDRLGGHLVQGHVDGVARIESVTPVGDARHAVVRPPAELLRYLASKGSVCLDGVSLTVNASARGVIELMWIPQTLAATTLGDATRGTELNIEIDLLARYAVHWLESSARGEPAGLEQALARAGYLDESRT